MWATIWKRIEGDNLSCHFNQYSYVFDWATEAKSQEVGFTIRLEEGGIRYHSMYDGTEFYAVQPTITDNQATLNSRVTLSSGWASTHDDPTNRQNSIFHANTGDVLMVTAAATPAYNSSEKKYFSTITTAGASPVNLLNTEDQWVDHQDYLHVHLAYSYGGKNITSVDSVLVTRRIYHRETDKELICEHAPFDYMFPYATTAQQQDFTISAKYEATTKIVNKFGTVVSSSPGEVINPLRIDNLQPIKDTLWTDEEHTDYTKVLYFDTLVVQAFADDGVTPANWIQSVTLTSLNQFRVVAKPYNSGTSAYRVAMIKYRYTYLHSYAEGDTVRAENVIWLMQAPEDQSAAPIQFYHQTGKSGLPMVGPRSRQQVPELTYTYYVIPDTVNNLPIHHDHWGYYRWYIYKQGANTGKGIVNNWDWTTMPTNTQTPPQPFGQLNPINSQWSRGLFEFSSKLTPGTATAIPAVQLNTTKLGGSAINFDDTLAVDISAYTDTLCTGHYSTSSLSSLTEPTLSYRQLFAMRPAKESADLMATCRTADNTYLQDEDCFAPINRPFILQPTSPYKTENNVDEGNLQYVYYYNPNPTDTIDTYMGLKNGAGTGDTLHINKGYAYNRVGLSKQTGRKRWHARLMSADEVLALKNGDTKTILLVNPRKDGGYILGGNGDKKKEYKQDVITSSTNADELRQHIEDNILNATGFDYATSYYPLTLTKTGTNTITLRNNLIDDDLCAHVSVTIPILGTFGEGVDWYNTTWLGSSSTSIIISSHSSASPDDLGGKAINGVGSALLKMYMSITALNSTYQGYLTAWSTRKPLFGSRYYYQTNAHLDGLNATEAGGSNTINQGWCFYEISLEDESFNHKEWGKWQRKVSDGDWQDLDDGWTGTELDGGALQTAYNGTNGEVVEYRLITQHFLLAHFAVTMRPVNTQGPSTTAIISEADIEQDYDVIASFGLEEDLGAPGTQEMVAAYHPLQFNHTQFAYHYPVGNGDHQIPASQRVTGSDLLPTKGEYCIINKFEKAGDSNYDVVEAGGGAEHGWMFCYNRAPKPLVFIDFEYPKPACTDQDLMLVSNFCQPNKVSQENPHVKADFYGHMPGRPADEWVKIFTYLTSNFNEAGQWYQLALPLRWSDIGSFDKYRCVGTVSAAEGAGSYLLFDRFRLLAKKNPMTSFQKRVSMRTTRYISSLAWTIPTLNCLPVVLSAISSRDGIIPLTAGRVVTYR